MTTTTRQRLVGVWAKAAECQFTDVNEKQFINASHTVQSAVRSPT